MRFHLERDPRKWMVDNKTANKAGFLMELVPKGDSIKMWKEMSAHQVVFTKVSLRKYVDTWKEMLVKADPQVDLKEEATADGSLIVTYTSLAANETSMRRFIKGSDGVYMLAYHVRPKLIQPKAFAIWGDIIRTASLMPNPEKKK
jgi:hypothetical protein